MKNIDKLHQLGQSLWYDNIQRSLLDNGDLKKMIETGKIKGVTSNPSIFHNAIVKTKDYDEGLQTLAWSGLNAAEIFWELAVKDIQDAADLFADLYEASHHIDGYVSLEVSPFLAKDSQGTIREARRLWAKVNRPNLMIKIPATLECLPAIRAAIADGINVNVTLIFSLERYKGVIDAFMSGLEDRVKKGKSIESIASVASFFVSRVDSKVDALLSKKAEKETKYLFGKAAIANAKMAYEVFCKEFASERFARLLAMGAQKQRPLWASTSTKNPNYRDVIYVEELIADESVNTVPPATLDAFADHGKAALTIGKELPEYKEALQSLENLGISMAKVTQELEEEGVKAFSDAFDGLLKSVEDRRQAQLGGLSVYADKISKRLARLEKENFTQRMNDHDPSLWTADVKGQDEIRIRMDWLSAPWDSEALLPQLETLLAESRAAGFTHALLLGMGGSSLAPEVLRLINGQTKYKGKTGLDLGVLDSTNPDEVLLARKKYPLKKTLYIVASKSGTTGEINAFYQYFWDEVTNEFGKEAGQHFLAITDPGTKLDKLASEKGFWKVFNANPNVGGRNSALTAFGLVPAALLGFDVRAFLKKAQWMANKCKPGNGINANPGVVLGAIMAEATKAGQDKLTLVTDPEWNAFGNWLEQLVAESSGKEGKGIIPVANQPKLTSKEMGEDRLFVYLGLDAESNDLCRSLRSEKRSLLTLNVENSLDLASQFYLWEYATAVACSILGVNSFDQPDVQDAKTRTLAGIASFKQTGKLDFGTPAVTFKNGEIYSNQKVKWQPEQSMRANLELFLDKVLRKGDYIGLNVFLPRTQEMEADLQDLRLALIRKYGNAVTLGFGPRFLHSTGQLHKGGPNTGLFIEFTADPKADMEIPQEGLNFGTMVMAQALGDAQALEAKGRRLLRIHLHKPSLKEL